ncbi:MAG: MBL fold metallo-hydrolase [Mycobacteriaceae bacterium]
MRLTHFGHSCLLLELNGTKILFDPGTFSHGFEGISDLDAILITHQHPDHADPSRLAGIIENNPEAAYYCDPQTAQQFGAQWTAVTPGDSFFINTVQVRGTGGQHAVIHPDIPIIDNIAYLLGSAADPGQFLHPGDSLFLPEEKVDVLALPAVAPWMKISETVDYLRAVAPRIAVPIHQGILAESATGIYYSRFQEMSDKATDFYVLEPESAAALS